MTTNFTLRLLLCLVFMCLITVLLPDTASAQISMEKEITQYTQDFNALPGENSGIWENGSSYIDGWFVQRTKQTNTIVANPGNNLAGGLYSFGSVGSTDRALGSQSSTNAGEFAWGLLLQNNTGDTVQFIDVSFYGEQWRISNINAGEHKVDFYYAVSSDQSSFKLSPRSDEGWISYPDLTFKSPHFYVRGRALNGNAVANRKLLTAVLPVNVPAGHYLMLRWKDANEYETDHGLGIDDVSIRWTVKPDEPAVVLPVEFMRFTARSSGTVVQLQWLTASETQNDHFLVERSSNGLTFENIGKVAGKGTTAQGAAYNFVDEHPFTGVSYYRLKQVDEDASHAYSAIVTVARPAANKVAKVYPTITTGKLKISTEQTGSLQKLLVLDVMGRQLLQKALDVNTLHHNLDVSQLNGGTYVLVLLDEQGQRQTTRFLKR